MSRIGKAPITIPAGVQVNISDANVITVKGPKGELNQPMDTDMSATIDGAILTVERPTEQKRHKAFHGLYRSLIANMLEGVSKGFVKELELIGVGYRAAATGQNLELAVGFSHPCYIPIA